MSTQGNGYLGSSSMQVSTANKEIVPSPPSHWTTGYKLYKFSFNNKQATQVIINKITAVYLEAGQGFEINRGDAPIFSFVIVSSDVNYNFIAAY